MPLSRSQKVIIGLLLFSKHNDSLKKLQILNNFSQQSRGNDEQCCESTHNLSGNWNSYKRCSSCFLNWSNTSKRKSKGKGSQKGRRTAGYHERNLLMCLMRSPPAGSKPGWIVEMIGKEKLSKADLEGPAFMITLDLKEISFPSLWIGKKSGAKEYDSSDRAAVMLGIEEANQNYSLIWNKTYENWDASDFPFRKRKITIPNEDDENKNEVHKFSDANNRKLTEEDKRRSGKGLYQGLMREGQKIRRIYSKSWKGFVEHPSETKVFHNEDGNPARANIQQALGSYERSHKGVKASANSDIVYFFTTAQYGDPLQDDIFQLIIFIVDSRCTKHMTGNLTLLCNFVEKYLGTVRFGNDQFAPILGYGDLVQGNITINMVDYVEGLNHNLFSVGQFCDADLEVAFWKSTCFVRDL
ncbi:hypothetical protein Tco_1113515 [Tanacetum coccineum]|uniref:Retrovirus-related Pol polyprotein from transposon TNT 1-94-like beta-barrel domain-containing protein n=1 Tax=Tanacetum coccineum TaxID=301880 RepID=A0ABQ5ISF5_9ASTR